MPATSTCGWMARWSARACSSSPGCATTDDARLLAVEVADTRERGDLPGAVPAAEGAGLARGARWSPATTTPGLRAAIARHFQGASWQRCQVHFARNLQGRVGVKHRARLAADLRAIFAAPDAAQARATARTCAERWRASHPAVATAAGGGPRALPGLLRACPPRTGCGCARPTAWNGSTRS